MTKTERRQIRLTPESRAWLKAEVSRRARRAEMRARRIKGVTLYGETFNMGGGVSAAYRSRHI